MTTRRQATAIQATPIIVRAKKRTMQNTVRQLALRQSSDPLVDDPDLELIDPEFDSGAESFGYAEAGIAPRQHERFF